jgi:Ca2+-binding RTX toxin-like protein
MTLPSETVTFAGSGIVFNNTYDNGVTQQVHDAIVAAENYLQAHFTNSVTVNVEFDFEPTGQQFAASNNFSSITVAYSDLVAALTAHATSADDRLAVAGLPTVDPSNGAGFRVPIGQAEALGLGSADTATDVTVTIGSDQPWNYGSDIVGAVEHELSEGVFGRFGALGTTASGRYTVLDLFRFNASGQRDYSGGADGQYTVFGVDGSHPTDWFFHNSISPPDLLHPTGQNDGFDLGDWDFEEEDAFGSYHTTTSISPVDLQVLDVIGWTSSGAPAGSGPDDFADSFADTTHPFGQLTVGTPFIGALQAIGDRDWFAVTLNSGTDYVVYLTGADGGGGTLKDPVLRLHDASGAQVAFNDDQNFDTYDSRIIFHPTTSGTYYIDARAYADDISGSYTVKVMAGATASTPGDDFLVGAAAGGTIMAGAGNDTIVADDVQNYLRGEDGNDSIIGGAAFDDINGNMGNDTIDGGLGDDWVVGGKGDDSQSGYDGDDIVWGNLGNDTLDGGFGNDQVRGGQGDDSISGGYGNDYISGDRGNDTESGGPGADMFHTFSGAGIDKVLDFSYAQGDRVMLDPGTTYTASQVGADTIVDMGNGDQMILVGVTLATLPSDWIFTGP